MMDDLKQFLPLSPAVLHILPALSSEDRHGYGIMQEVARPNYSPLPTDAVLLLTDAVAQ
jgi:hypothetical protein